jgi:hypothetical protein
MLSKQKYIFFHFDTIFFRGIFKYFYVFWISTPYISSIHFKIMDNLQQNSPLLKEYYSKYEIFNIYRHV